MFSPSLPASCVSVSPTVEPSNGSAATSPSPCDATNLVSSASSDVKSLPLATKSVLQLSSTMAATLPSTTTSTAPSVASRSLSLPALARPLARRRSRARSTSPSDSSSAFLQSIIPAPVALRSAEMSLAEYSAIRVALLDLGGARVGRRGLGLGRPDSGSGAVSAPVAVRLRPLPWPRAGGLHARAAGRRRRRAPSAAPRPWPPAPPGVSCLGCGGAGLAAFAAVGRAGLGLLARPQPLTLDDRVGDDAAHQVGGADGVVVAGDHEVDDVGIAVGVDDGDHRDARGGWPR